MWTPYECHMILGSILKLRSIDYFNKATFCVVLLCLLGLSSVYAQNPVASFTIPSNQGCVPFNVQFTNTSQNAVSYQWDFGNGNTSTQVNPSNVFTTSGTFTVTLTALSASGASNSSLALITVQPKPISLFSISQTSGCQGSQLFSFQNMSSGFDSCTWDFGDGTTSNQLNPQHIYNISGTFSVILVVYNKQFGCSDVSVQNAAIVVYPTPSATITANDSITCDQQFNFQFNSVMSNALSWTWLFGDGTSSQLANPSHVYSDTGYFSVSLIMTSANGCIDTITKSNYIHIKWNPVPIATISDDSGCKPHYLALITSYYAGATYSWNLGNGVTKSGSSVYYTYADSGTFPLTLNVAYSSGCSQTISAGSIVVFPRPTFSYSFSNGTGCAPLPVQFTIVPIGGPYTWLWDFGDGQTSTQFNPVHIYTTNGSYQVSLTATSVNGCSLGYPLNGSVKVFSPDARFTPDVTSGCAPLLVNFNNQSVNATSWLWQFGDGTTSTVQHPTHTYNANGTYQVRLIVNDINGCSDTLVYPVLINVSQGVVNYITPPNIQGCAPYAVNFSDASGASAYSWNFGDGTTSTLANPYHIYTEPGIYTVSLTTWMPNGGCEQYIANFQTFEIGGADPGFTYTVSPCPPYEVFFTDTSLNAASWIWSFGDGGSASVQNPSHVYPGPGSYNVTMVVTTPGGCTTTLQANNGVVITGMGANASAVCADTVAPFNVQFYANSTGATWWSWNFGDGDSSSLENPQHTFTGPGPFNITLTIGNDSCIFTYDYPPITFGSATGTGGGLGGGGYNPPAREYHCAPYTVNFSNPDQTALGWIWDFGDGTTSNLPSPEHVYTDSGAFVPTLYMTNIFGTIDTLVYTDTFFVVKPFTDFIISTTNLCNGVIVDVQTSSPAVSYNWNFGNGLTFSTPVASHTYPNVNASYMVSLDVVDTNNCPSFVAKSFAVNATSPLSASTRRACAGDSISFDPGNVNYASYLWTFSDGTTDAIRNPVHVFQDSGFYSVSLLVTDINGCQLTFNLMYQIEVFDPLADFSFVPPITNCTSLLVNFTNLSMGSTSWFWNFGDSTTSNQQNPIHTYLAPGYHDVTLTAFKNVCSNVKVLTNAVYVSQMIPAFTYSVNNNCVPATVSFTDQSVDAVSWHWDFGDGDTSTLQNPSHVYLGNPTDSVTLTVRDINGCLKSISVLSPVITAANIYVAQSGGCVPFAISFIDSSSSAVSWEWDFGDGTNSLLQNPVHSYSADGFYNVSLIVTSATGCKDTLTLDSLVEVNTPVASFTADSTVGCAPLLVNFTDQSSNAITWNWSFGNGSISGNQFPSLFYTTPGSYDVELVVENKFGCTDSVRIDSLILVRGPIPSFITSVNSGCAPLPITFLNLTQGGVSWQWHFGDGLEDTSANPVHIYNDPGSYTVSLYAFDSSGCSSIYSMPTSIDVGISPQLSFVADVTSGCSPLTVSIDDTGTLADSLVWLMGDGSVLTGNMPVYTYTQAGTYIITLIAYNSEGCSDTLEYGDTIYVNEQPHADFYSDIQEGCEPVIVSFVDSSQGLNNASYLWDFGDGSYSNLQNPQYTYTASGLYTITLIVTNGGGCSDTISKPDYIDIYDQNPPPVTPLYHVSVTAPDRVLLEWQLTNVRDLNYYIVYKLDKSTSVYDSIAQVFQTNTGINNNIPFYVDSTVNPDADTYAYKIQAVDKCGYRADYSALRAHETILLSAVGGHQKVDLNWSAYGGCSVLAYEIYRQDNLTGPFQLVGMVDSLTYSYSDTTAVCPMPYSFKVRAVEICGNPIYDSWSNDDDATPTSDINDQFVDVVRSTVVDDEYVLTEWGDPVILPGMVDRYDIFRSTDNTNFTLIASVPPAVHEYSDFNVAVDAQEYYYKVMVQNICNLTGTEGQPGSSILLQRIELGLDNLLKWTKYLNWDTGVEIYVIEKLNNQGVWEEVDRVPGNVTEWEEK